MATPGWYKDPSGQPGHFRWWDGRSWSQQTTTNPASLPHGPVGVPGMGAPGTGPAGSGSGNRRTWWIVGIIGALVLALGIGWAALGLARRDVPSVPTSTQVATPDEEAPSAGTSPGEAGASGGSEDDTTPDICMAGNDASIPKGSAGKVTNWGLAATVPTDWGFRLDKDQWPWLNDIWSYGSNNPGERAVTIGHLPKAVPDGEAGLRQQWACWTTQGFLQDQKVSPELPGKVTAVTAGGMPGFETTFTATTSSGPLHVRMATYKTAEGRVSVLAFHDDKAAADKAADEIDAVFSSIAPA